MSVTLAKNGGTQANDKRGTVGGRIELNRHFVPADVVAYDATQDVHYHPRQLAPLRKLV